MSRGGPIKPAHGQHVRFIRYIRLQDGWTTQILRGEFIARTEAGWQIRIDGEARELSHEEWTFYRQ